LVVSESVYDAFLRRQLASRVTEATIDGILHFAQVPLLHPDLLKSIGSQIDSEFLATLPIPNNLPQIYIHVASPLDVRFRFHNSHPPGCIWAIERSIHHEQLVWHTEGGLLHSHAEIRPCEPYSTYEVRATIAALHDHDDIRAKVETFKNGVIRTPLKSSVECSGQ
jgi:hypothetical protein